jgi:hypothetical protein
VLVGFREQVLRRQRHLLLECLSPARLVGYGHQTQKRSGKVCDK